MDTKEFFDAVTGRWVAPVAHTESVSGARAAPAAPPSAPAPKPASAPVAPPTSLLQYPVVLLAMLKGREPMTPDVESYLLADLALEQYEAVLWADLASGRTTQDESSLAQSIAVAWRDWLDNRTVETLGGDA